MEGSQYLVHLFFFSLPTNDNGMGGLDRVLSDWRARWLCRSHAFLGRNTDALEKYVRSQGGSISLQLSTITISLTFLMQVEAFSTAVAQSNHVFDLSLNLTWNPSRCELQDTLQCVSQCRASILEIHGAAFDLQQKSWEYSSDLYARHLGVNLYNHPAQLVTLLHPLRSQSYTYFRRNFLVAGFLFEGVPNTLNVIWAELRSDLVFFESSLSDVMRTHDLELDEKWAELSHIVKPVLVQGLKGVDIFDLTTHMLHFRLEIMDGAITGIKELHVSSHMPDLRKKEQPVLQRLVIRPDVPNGFVLMNEVMVKSPKLQMFDIPILERGVFMAIAILYRDWPGTRSVQVT